MILSDCIVPNGYTRAQNNSRKAYKKVHNSAYFNDAKDMCKADKAWLPMPKSSDDLANIYKISKTVKNSDCLMSDFYLVANPSNFSI